MVSTTLKKFKFGDEFMDDVAFLLPNNRPSVSVSSMLRLAARFSASLEESDMELEEETLDYILLPSHSLPAEDEEIEGRPDSDRLCVYWNHIGRMTTLHGLIKLAKCILALPVSNANTEIVFSIVRKIITDYRTQLNQETLCSLLACKVNNDSECFQLETPIELLRQAKVTTKEYNQAHTKSKQA